MSGTQPRYLSKSLIACALLVLAASVFPFKAQAQPETRADSRVPFSDTALRNRDIRVLTPAGASRVTPDNVAAIPAGAIFAERIEETTRDLQTGDVTLPFSYRTLLDSGEELRFRAKLIVLRAISFDDESDTFKGRLGLGVLSDTHPQARGEFDNPVSFTLAGDADSINPTQLEIGHLNQPFEEVDIAVREPGQEVTLQVFASFAPDEPETVSLESSRPQLTISIAPSRIDGFGLAVADVRVEAINDYAGRTVSLGYDQGRVEKSVLQLDENGIGQTQIRSQFVGAAGVTASGYPFTPATATVEFSWPVALFVLGIFGAIGGALVRKFAKDESGAKFGVSVFCGFIGTLLAALGVNFLNLPVTIPFGEGFTFVVAALSAYAGPAIFSMISPKLA